MTAWDDLAIFVAAFELKNSIRRHMNDEIYAQEKDDITQYNDTELKEELESRGYRVLSEARWKKLELK